MSKIGPELAGTSDLGRRWGVSRERARQLSKLPGFPEPIGHVSGRRVYDVDECDAWRKARLEEHGKAAA